MREVQSSDAKARFSQILDEVERGETIAITRHGRTIARIVPEVGCRQEEIRKAMGELKEFKKTMPTLTLAEILLSRHEGHKY